MTSSPTPAVLPDARALIAEMASHSGPEPRFIERCRAYLAATPPASDAAVPARELERACEQSWDATHTVLWRHASEQRRAEWAVGIRAALAAAAPKVASDTGAGLALRAIKAVTATAKDGPAGLSRIMAIANAAGVKAQYTDLLADPDVALIVERPRTEWAHLFKPDAEGCAIPPAGWHCSRARGHTGPCAATPTDATDGATGGGEDLAQRLTKPAQGNTIAMLAYAAELGTQPGIARWLRSVDNVGEFDSIRLSIAITALALATTPGGDLLEQAASSDRSLTFVIAEAKHNLRLTQGCMECNAEDERRWSETIEWLEGLA